MTSVTARFRSRLPAEVSKAASVDVGSVGSRLGRNHGRHVKLVDTFRTDRMTGSTARNMGRLRSEALFDLIKKQKERPFYLDLV